MIKLTNKSGDVLIRVDCIECIESTGGMGIRSIISLSNGKYVEVLENPKEVMERIVERNNIVTKTNFIPR